MGHKIIERQILNILKKTPKSVILLGPRQVGKSTLIHQLKPDLEINLYDELDFLKYSSQPGELVKVIESNQPKTIFIDEIQRLPRLLNTIQTLIDMHPTKYKFYLTGSSARKLRKGGANLLPGRVIHLNLGPFIASEFNYKMNTQKVLEYGSLPEIYLSNNQLLNKQILRSYSASYLKEEIKAEALTRSLESFARFFHEAIANVGKFIDFTKLSKKAKISRFSIPRYYEILEDTLIGQRIYPYPQLTESLDLIRHPQFFLFDCGVYNGLLGNFTSSADRIGTLAEQLVFSQIHHSALTKGDEFSIHTFRTRNNKEVDFILVLNGKTFGIEVKTTDQINTDDLSGLQFLAEQDKNIDGLFVFHMGTKKSKFGKIECLPWQDGLRALRL